MRSSDDMRRIRIRQLAEDQAAAYDRGDDAGYLRAESHIANIAGNLSTSALLDLRDVMLDLGYDAVVDIADAELAARTEAGR